jgi:hypothetical protein
MTKIASQSAILSMVSLDACAAAIRGKQIRILARIGFIILKTQRQLSLHRIASHLLAMLVVISLSGSIRRAADGLYRRTEFNINNTNRQRVK